MPLDYQSLSENRHALARDSWGSRPPLKWTLRNSIILFRVLLLVAISLFIIWLLAGLAMGYALANFCEIILGMKLR